MPPPAPRPLPSPALPPLPPGSPFGRSPQPDQHSPALPPLPSDPTTPTGPPNQDINLLPLAPLPVHLAPFLLPSSPLSAQEKRELFTAQFLRSASSGNADTLEWLLSVPESASTSSAAARRFSTANLGSGPDSKLEELLPDQAPRKWVDVEARDEDGNSALGLCVALGHAEGVRVIVEGGADVMGRDTTGWTPLHWAVQNNDIPIAAYLLNHRASPTTASHKGLTPLDLLNRGREGSAMREVLQSAQEAAHSREREKENGKGKEKEGDGERPHSRASSVASTSKGSGWSMAEEQAREKDMKKRLELAKVSALHLEVDFDVLSVKEDQGPGWQDEHENEEDDEPPAPFVWDRCMPDQMLVFTLDDLQLIFDVVITNMKPVRARKYRVTPANVIFLCARYAHYFGSVDLVEELFLSAIERIEAAVHNRPDDMANCAFWLSNSLLLLYYLRKEPNLFVATAEYQVHLADLINEIFVFVIRDAERRIDRILEAAILEHEALPGFEDVQFEGDWSSNRFVKKLTGRGKKSIPKSTSLRSLFAEASESGASSSENPAPGAPATPRSVTSLLSSTLFILQLYEIPPSIVVQAFSQLFYWVSCEIFNRLLIQKKYLCRSKALQIRLNSSAIEDWARLNRMPTKMCSIHFAPLNQLLQWLQCLSSESSIDGLIGTIQSLRSLNPLQLRRAVREYRYEVDEAKMSEDCEQYLLQIQKQWERLRVQKTVEELESGGGGGSTRSSSPTGSSISVQSDVVRMIDEVFADRNSFGHYTPPGGVEALGELLNSRYMLPFAVPSSAEMLVNFRSKDAFGPFSSPDPQTSGAETPRSVVGSEASRRASVALNGAAVRLATGGSDDGSDGQSPIPEEEDLRFIPTLPEEFFAVLDAAKEEAYGQQQGSRPSDGLGFELDDDSIPRNGDDDAFMAGMSSRRGMLAEDEEYQVTPRPPTGFART
ncbi:DIL and Ankyrin domain containing protein [Pseudohyphozyma bogoriensis]|nr:DIL and Ankyrin domain containing protein [Pseudohyphozyma bogoriensis]